MASITQRSISVAVFTGAIAVGMQIAGPTVETAVGQAGTVRSANGVPMMAPARAPEDQYQPPAQAAPPPATDASNLQQQQLLLQQMQQTQDPNQQGGNNPLDFRNRSNQVPDFTDGKQGGDSGNNNNNNNGKNKKPTRYIPSEVETFIPSMANSGDPRAIIHTTFGNITMRLHSTRAPLTVRNFIDLSHGDREFLDVHTSKKSHRPFYNNLTFFRVLPGYVIAAGCPYGTGRGGPGYTIPDEINPALHFDHAGMVAMAPELKGVEPIKDSNGSQFFITLAPMPDWDGKYTIFGEVISGMEIVEKISHSPAGPTNRPIKRIFIDQIEVLDEAAAATPPVVAGTAPPAGGAPAPTPVPADNNPPGTYPPPPPKAH